MLLQNSLNLENEIVRLLSQSPRGMTAEQLRSVVARSFRPYSSRGMYKELQRLMAEGVLVRNRATYTLRIAWLLSLQGEIDRITQQIKDPDYLRGALPTQDQPVIMHARDLVTWDRYWTQLMLMMHTLFPRLPMFIWSPRHWFMLTHPDIEGSFTKANEFQRNLRYLIIGGRSFLDFRDRDIVKRKSTCFSFRESPFEFDRSHYYWIIGDYVGTNTLDAVTVRAIDEIYASVKNEREVVPSIRAKLLNRKCRGSVNCELAPDKADRLRAKFLKYFGVDLKKNGELRLSKVGEV